MAQSTDYLISNQSGAAVRAELNSILAAIASFNSGDTEPTTTYALMPWFDTTGSTVIFKIRNEADTAWITIGDVSQAYMGLAHLGTTQNFTKPQRSADTVDNDGSFDLNASQNFTCTPTGNFTMTFTNIPDGQSGVILLVNTGGHTVSAAATTKVMGADFLSTVSTAGTYIIGYYSDGTNVRVYNSGVQQ